jgi:hypothetical protein
MSGRRISPGVVFLAIAIIGSVAYLGYVVTVRDASQIPLLASGAVVLGISFLALALYSLQSAWRAGMADRGRRALLLGILGGLAAMATAAAFTGAFILFQLAPA